MVKSRSPSNIFYLLSITLRTSTKNNIQIAWIAASVSVPTIAVTLGRMQVATPLIGVTMCPSNWLAMVDERDIPG